MLAPVLAATALLAAGCQSTADQGALFGGATGAVLGGVVGNKIDESEARNRALIEQRLGHAVSPGAVSIEDVIAMTRAGVNEQVIVTHVNNNGVARPVSTSDITYLTQNGVSSRVIQAMENPARSAAPPQTVVVQGAPPPVIVEERYYDPYWGPHYYRPYPYYGGYYHRPGVAVGVALH
jgi:hypothetical protein